MFSKNQFLGLSSPSFFSFFLCFLFYPSLLPLWASQVALVVKNLPANAGDPRSIPGLERFCGGEHGTALQDSCLENPMDRGAWRAAVHRVTKSQTQLSDLACKYVTFMTSSLQLPYFWVFPLDFFEKMIILLLLHSYFSNKCVWRWICTLLVFAIS